jgi:hypothetical protein
MIVKQNMNKIYTYSDCTVEQNINVLRIIVNQNNRKVCTTTKYKRTKNNCKPK